MPQVTVVLLFMKYSMNITYELAAEAASYYCELTAGADEDTLTISPEADKVLGMALEEGLCEYFSAEDIMEVLGRNTY